MSDSEPCNKESGDQLCDSIEKPKPDLRPCGGGCGHTLAPGLGLRYFRLQPFFPPESFFCFACYQHYKRTGGFERPRNERKLKDDGLCTDCMDPGRVSCYSITENTKANNRDWSKWWGGKLCKKCYNKVLKNGTTEPKKRTPPTNSLAKSKKRPRLDKEKK